jgi:hypothetical protein
VEDLNWFAVSHHQQIAHLWEKHRLNASPNQSNAFTEDEEQDRVIRASGLYLTSK